MSVDDGQVQRRRLDAVVAEFVEATGELEQALPHIGHGEWRIVPAANAYPQFPGCESLTLHPFIVSPMKAALQIARRLMVRTRTDCTGPNRTAARSRIRRRADASRLSTYNRGQERIRTTVTRGTT